MSVQRSTLLNRRRIRRTFGKINEVAQMPNLIEVQRNSYEQFLQMYDPVDERTNVGLQAVFSSVFPIKDFVGRSMLEFVSYTLEDPKYDVDECHQRGLTYASPLRLTLRLIVWDLDPDTGTKSIRDMKEQDVYMGDQMVLLLLMEPKELLSPKCIGLPVFSLIMIKVKPMLQENFFLLPE